jgi:hypothetical protein
MRAAPVFILSVLGCSSSTHECTGGCSCFAVPAACLANSCKAVSAPDAGFLCAETFSIAGPIDGGTD